VRLAAARAQPYAAISAGVSGVWAGARGANEADARDARGHRTVDNIDKFLARVKTRTATRA